MKKLIGYLDYLGILSRGTVFLVYMHYTDQNPGVCGTLLPISDNDRGCNFMLYMVEIKSKSQKDFSNHTFILTGVSQ